ncbi:Variable large protein 15/16 (plasmid) [Borrelia turicatae]|uniref:Variable large protein n=1 Tax=Borrelia turicatae TaxID=142 RepID=A0A172XD18_BORTU|nr:variable large family protein [Borrelia turicatae]ANF34575.1 Variable large protein 15/16 [Borrelia turicatae]UPA15746.1 variable large family protein [Borrelia turicatae]
MKRITLSVLLMTLFLLLSCGSGSAKAEDPKTLFLTSIANLGKGFLDVFTSFSDMVADVFGIKAETKKSDIGKYFTSIENTMTSVKKKLQDEVAKNGNYSKIKSVVDHFITNTLDKIAEGAKTAATGATTDVVIGNAKQNEDAAPGETASVNSLVKGIKTIVDVVLTQGEGDATATKTAEEQQKNIGKLFGKKDDDRAQEAQAAAASASIGAVTGADILKAIVSSKENPATDANDGIENAKDAAEIAVAPAVDDKNEIKDAGLKDAVIAAGIALRAMAKGGKFAAKNGEEKSAHAVNGAVASAVGKTLSTLIIAIRNTVDTGLKSISDALATVTQEDRSSEATKSADATASGQQ